MEIPLADPDVVIIFDMSSSKHSTDVKKVMGTSRGLLFLISFGDLGKLLILYVFPLTGNPVCRLFEPPLSGFCTHKSSHFPGYYIATS